MTPLPKPDEWDDDIHWLVNEAAGFLGLKAQPIREYSGEVTIADNGPHHDKMIDAGWAVRKARRLERYWAHLTQEERRILAGRYDESAAKPFGFSAAFEELAGVAVEIATGDGNLQEVRDWCSNIKRNGKDVLALRRRAAKASRAAHKSWHEAKRLQGASWVEEARA